MINPSVSSGVTLEARIFVLIGGVLFMLWTVLQLRRRKLLVQISASFIGISLFFIVFALIPDFFDTIAFGLGVKYPPLLYLLGIFFLLMVLIANLASKLTVTDERCRRLVQEIALIRSELEEQGLNLEGSGASDGKGG